MPHYVEPALFGDLALSTFECGVLELDDFVLIDAEHMIVIAAVREFVERLFVVE